MASQIMQYVTFSFIRAASNLLFWRYLLQRNRSQKICIVCLQVCFSFSVKCLSVMQKLYAVLLQCHILNYATKVELKYR